LLSPSTDAEPELQVKDLKVASEDGYSLPLRIFFPPSQAPLPVIVWYHGGGFVMGGLNSHTCASFAQFLYVFQRLHDMKHALIDFGGCSVLAQATALATATRAPLCPSILGLSAAATRRYMAANVALACSAVVVAVDYRFAPEHPFPAAVNDSWAAYLWTAANLGARTPRSLPRVPALLCIRNCVLGAVLLKTSLSLLPAQLIFLHALP